MPKRDAAIQEFPKSASGIEAGNAPPKRRRGIGAVIPRKVHERRRGPVDRNRYRQRNRVERLINRCKQFRRITTRYEKRADNYHAMWLIAAIILWL